MKYFILLFAMNVAYAGQDVLSYANSFDAILQTQGLALESMNEPLTAQSFTMNEMITDIAFSKSGVMGLAALKANNGLEIKWKRVKSGLVTDDEKVDFSLEQDASEEDLESITASVMEVVKASGKVQLRPSLHADVHLALQDIQARLKNVQVTQFNNWELRHLRLDLSFSASGAVSFLTKAGIALRLRLEWKLKKLPLKDPRKSLENEDTRLVSKLLLDLDEAMLKIPIKNFEPKKVNIGVGLSRKGGLGLWKYSTGFIGFLGFVPVKRSTLALVSMPEELRTEDYELDGLESEDKAAAWWPWRKRRVPRLSCTQGLERGMRNTEFFAERADRFQGQRWRISEIKTVNDLTHTGFLGLADVSTRGIFEIEFKRN